jgi:hypothetical protein
MWIVVDPPLASAIALLSKVHSAYCGTPDMHCGTSDIVVPPYPTIDCRVRVTVPGVPGVTVSVAGVAVINTLGGTTSKAGIAKLAGA